MPEATASYSLGLFVLLAGLGCLVLVVCIGVAIFLLTTGKKEGPERRPE
jgi:hypothetical protein